MSVARDCALDYSDNYGGDLREDFESVHRSEWGSPAFWRP